MVEKVWNNPDIFCIPVDLPQNPLKSLNVYVICGSERNLIIDTGFNRPECRNALWNGIEEIGLDLSKTLLFLTHLHSDHTGLVWDFVSLGIPIYMGYAEQNYLKRLISAEKILSIYQLFWEEGFPRDQLQLQNTENQGKRYAPQPGYPTIPLKDGQILSLGDTSLTAIHTPGHTPGHTVLFLSKDQLLFAGDHILFDITPNISVWPDVPYSLADYMESLKKIRTLQIRATFPAHRNMNGDVYQRIDQLIEHHIQRLEENYQAVLAHPGVTAYELAGHITWSAHGLSWAKFPPHQRWFAVGEAVAHLYELMHKGMVTRRVEEGTARYFPSKSMMA